VELVLQVVHKLVSPTGVVEDMQLLQLVQLVVLVPPAKGAGGRTIASSSLRPHDFPPRREGVVKALVEVVGVVWIQDLSLVYRNKET